VRDNLTFFDRSLPDRQLLEAIELLGLSAWLDRLPAGLDTTLAPTGGARGAGSARGAGNAGSGTTGLSAGEAQLLALTRVSLKSPALVILDEASSRLDPATERLLERALDRLLAGRSAVIIAHRLATLRRADELLVLEDGRVMEHGPRERLAADPASHYARLLRVTAADGTPPDVLEVEQALESLAAEAPETAGQTPATETAEEERA